MRSKQSSTPWRAVVLGALLLAGAGLAPMSGSVGASEGDPAVRQREVREQRARAAARIDALQAEQGQVAASLRTLDENFTVQRSLAWEAAQEQQRAEAEASQAKTEEQARLAEIGTLQADAKRLAIQAYTGAQPPGLALLLGSSDVSQSLQATILSEIAVGTAQGTVERLDTARQDLTAARERSEAAAERAQASKERAQAEAASLQQAIDLQQQLSSQVDQRLDRALGEAAALARVDAQLSAQIVAREEALAAQVAKARAESEAAAKLQGLTIKGATPAARASGGSGSGGSGGSGSGGGGRSVAIIRRSGNLATVGGITVDASLAPSLARLLADASAAGLTLGGGGYRSPDEQIAVRRNNCGPSEYDIWQKPPSQCNPPAARPGTSMHEQGLAIDFTCNGSLITSRGNACFVWLRGNAGRYGLINLPVEPWHWSTNGR